MAWSQGFGPIKVHWNEPNPPHGFLPCFAPITRAEFDALRWEIKGWLLDPCTAMHNSGVEGEYADSKSRSARWREIKGRRAYQAEARAAKAGRP